MTASPFDAPLSASREHVENLATWIAVWEARKEPDPLARRCAGDAVAAVDAMLRDLYMVRGRLTAEVRQSDDELLRRRAVQTPTAESASRRDVPNRNHL